MSSSLNIVSVVCHPDDEALWIGGLLCELPKFPFLNVYVICLSGNNPASPRVDEFNNAQKSAGYKRGVVLGGKLRSALDPLPDTSKTVLEGLKKLNLKVDEISLLITHPPFGDEHINPHHRQTYHELLSWTQSVDIPFGYFANLPIPFFTLTPRLRVMKRSGSFHLLNLSECSRKECCLLDVFKKRSTRSLGCPRYYVQFSTDIISKERMLNCYPSIDIEGHRKGYASFTNPCEAIYLFDNRGLRVIQKVIDAMEVPNPNDLFKILEQPTLFSIVGKHIKNCFGK